MIVPTRSGTPRRRKVASAQPYGAHVSAQVARRGEEGRREYQRREEDQEDHLGGWLDLGQSRQEPYAEAPQNEEDRVGHPDHPSQLREQRHGPEQPDEKLYLVNG